MATGPAGTGGRTSTSEIDLENLERVTAEESARARAAAERDIEAAASAADLRAKPGPAPAASRAKAKTKPRPTAAAASQTEPEPGAAANPQTRPASQGAAAESAAQEAVPGSDLGGAKPSPKARPEVASAPNGVKPKPRPRVAKPKTSAEPVSAGPEAESPQPAKRPSATKRPARPRAKKPTAEPTTAAPAAPAATAEHDGGAPGPAETLAERDSATQADARDAVSAPEGIEASPTAANQGEVKPQAAGRATAAAPSETDAREAEAEPTEPTTAPAQAEEVTASVHLRRLLADVLAEEPPIGEGVVAVYQRAEKLRRRRLRRVVAAGIVSALVVAGFGFALATAVIPVTRHPSLTRRPVAAPAPAVDPLLVALDPVLAGNGLKATPKEPSAGPGWRQYAVVDRASGRPHGLIEVAAYAAPDGLCFPVRGDAEACAKPLSQGDDYEYARYSDDGDVDWQVHEAIARRLSDGRVIAVMATGERGTGERAAGRPPLNAAEVAAMAVDVRVMAAFAPDEACADPDPACPVLKVPVVVG